MGAVSEISLSTHLFSRPYVTEKKTTINQTTRAITRIDIKLMIETDSCRQRGLKYLHATDNSNMPIRVRVD